MASWLEVRRNFVNFSNLGSRVDGIFGPSTSSNPKRLIFLDALPTSNVTLGPKLQNSFWPLWISPHPQIWNFWYLFTGFETIGGRLSGATIIKTFAFENSNVLLYRQNGHFQDKIFSIVISLSPALIKKLSVTLPYNGFKQSDWLLKKFQPIRVLNFTLKILDRTGPRLKAYLE